jgi:hypothetical protein
LPQLILPEIRIKTLDDTLISLFKSKSLTKAKEEESIRRNSVQKVKKKSIKSDIQGALVIRGFDYSRKKKKRE